MRFPFGNKIPFATVIYQGGKKIADVLYGIPGDMDFELSDHKAEPPNIFLVGRKRGSRPLLIMIDENNLLDDHDLTAPPADSSVPGQ